jgi:hypothetical protein
LGGGKILNQQYPIFHRRPRRSQNGFYQPFSSINPYEQPSFQQFAQNEHPSMLQHSFQNQYQPQQPFQQVYQQPYQNSFQPYYGNGSNINGQFVNTPYPTPYPKPAPNFKQQPSGIQSVISQFKKSDGQLDINKMMDTAGQMMSAVNQMGGLFKGVTSMFK